MHDALFIYLIVALNALLQVLLIRRLRFVEGGRWRYLWLAAGTPVVVMLAMRLAIMAGAIHGRVADQSSVERLVTTASSIALLAGPWLVTVAAVLRSRRQGLHHAHGARQPDR